MVELNSGNFPVAPLLSQWLFKAFRIFSNAHVYIKANRFQFKTRKWDLNMKSIASLWKFSCYALSSNQVVEYCHTDVNWLGWVCLNLSHPVFVKFNFSCLKKYF